MIGISILIDAVMDSGECFIVLFRDHLVVRGAEMGWECDEENHDAESD